MAQTINVDVTPSLFQPTLYYHQGDIGREFAINISTKDGYQIPSGATAKIEATKPSGFGFSVDGTLSGSVVSFVSTEGMTDEWGRFPAQLKISSGNTVIYTANFLMVGEKDTHPASTVDGSQEDVIPQLTLLVERVENAAAAVLDTTTEVTTLPAGSQATYSFDEETNTATFGIPQGEAGAGSAGVVASAYSASKTYAVGDYAIHNSNLYRCTTAIATAESFTASHWTQVVLADDVTDLKSEISDYINGADRTFTISETGDNNLPMLVLKGVTYSFTNKTSAACTIQYLKADGTHEWVLGALNPNIPYYFVPDSDEYVGLFSYCNGTGTIEVSNYFSNTAVLDGLSDAINDGVTPIGKLVPDKYIATTGAETNYNGWSATDYIEVGSLYKVLRVTAPASSGGNYNAFYDSAKAFISNFPVGSGVNDITIPDNAVYVRLSNTTSNLQQTTIENIIGYLNRVVEELIPEPISTPSIYEWNIDESMVVNAGANYGFHSRGQSNVQKRFSMLVTTDPHGDATAMERAVEYLNDMPCFDCGACLGDLQSNTFTDNDGTWYTNAIKDSNKPWLTLIGNHDVGLGKSIASTGNQEQVYEKFIEPNLQYAGVTPDGKSYYYKDFDTYKIRLICLNAYDVDNNDTSGSEYVVPRYTEYYSQAQIDWFVSLLANTPTDYHVMILTHNTPKAATKDTNINFNNKTYSYSPESSQQGIVADIVDAWQRGVSLSHTYPCSNANLDSVTVSADFTSRGVGVLICFLTGHMHVDAIGHITSFANQNVFTLASTNTGTWQNEWSDLPRADGTKAEDCITALAVDTTNRDIYINRIGSSVSRWFTVREPSVISY